MITQSTVETLANWRRETVSRLEKVKEQEAALLETFQTSSAALKQVKFRGKKISWKDRAAVMEMLEVTLAGVVQMMTKRGEDLQLQLANIDKFAQQELPPHRQWEWPTAHDTSLEH